VNVLERIFGSRKVWVALAALGVVLASVFGLDPETATKVATAVVALATAVIGAIGYEDGKAKGNTIAGPTPAVPPRSAGAPPAGKDPA
jgi:hypothetical protein